MRLSNGEVWLAREPLSKLMAERLPVKVAYRLAKMGKEITERAKVIDQVRSGLVIKYGGTEALSTRNGLNWDGFAREFDELMAEEEDIGIEPVLVSVDDLEIEANVLLPLLKFIVLNGEA